LSVRGATGRGSPYAATCGDTSVRPIRCCCGRSYGYGTSPTSRPKMDARIYHLYPFGSVPFRVPQEARHNFDFDFGFAFKRNIIYIGNKEKIKILKGACSALSNRRSVCRWRRWSGRHIPGTEQRRWRRWWVRSQVLQRPFYGLILREGTTRRCSGVGVAWRHRLQGRGG
jgi:hypothetical protein